MKQTHGVILWLVVLFAILPIADGLWTGVPPDLTPHQHYWMSNFVAVLMIAALILGMACLFNERHA